MGNTTTGKQFGSYRDHKPKHCETTIQEFSFGCETPVAN